MTCLETQEWMVAYLDGETPPELEADIAAHLEGCAACREEADLLKATSMLVRNQPLLQPSESWDLKMEGKRAALKSERLEEEVSMLRRTLDELNARILRMEQKVVQDAAHHDLMTVEEVAAYLRMPLEKVFEMVEDMPHLEFGYELRFRRESIDAWLALREAGATSSVESALWSDWIDGQNRYLTS